MIHIGLTLNPKVPQPPENPIVISLNPWLPMEYINGLRNPRGGLSLFNRTSFRRATTAAKVGAAAEVPLTNAIFPPRTISKFSPWAATSGYAYLKMLLPKNSLISKVLPFRN